MKRSHHNSLQLDRPPLARRMMLHAVLGVLALMFALPLIWMLSTSVKPEKQAASERLTLLPDPPSSVGRIAAENYEAVWNDSTVLFPLYLRNTLIVAALSVVGMTASSALVAYGLSRVEWRGRSFVFVLVMATMMIPFPVLMVPLYMVFRGIDRTMESVGILPAAEGLRMMGTLKPLWLPAFFGGAFNIFMLRQFFKGIPKEIDEAARIDGCSHWGIFWRMILPLSRPALAVVALFHFVYVWNDFLGPLIFLTHRDQYTLALGLQLYQSQAGNTPWNLLMAASTMVAAPVVLVFLTAERTFVQGIAAEGIK